MPTEVLVPIGTPFTQWLGNPSGTTFEHLNVDETMASIDTSDWNRHNLNNKTIKHIVGKVTDLGPINSIKLAMNVKRYRTQGSSALRLNVYLAGSRVVPETEISVDIFVSYTATQEVWLANQFLAPWIGLTGQQWNDEIDLDPNAAQFWMETYSADVPLPPNPPPYIEEP